MLELVVITCTLQSITVRVKQTAEKIKTGSSLHAWTVINFVHCALVDQRAKDDKRHKALNDFDL